MLIETTIPAPSPLRADILAAYRMDEDACVENLLKKARMPGPVVERIKHRAKQLVAKVREQRIGKGGLDAFLYEYDLASQEGIALMCLAEAMLRIPDKNTVDELIRDKISKANWSEHIGHSDSLFVNAATWGLLLTGKILSDSKTEAPSLSKTLKRWVERTSEPVIRTAVGQAMKILGQQFVMGETIESAIKRARDYEKRGYRYSYDMLGEAARTRADAARYLRAYEDAIVAIGKASQGKGVVNGPGISIKLSALYPRYEYAKRVQVLKELIPILKQLALKAKAANIGLTVDAEEAERLDLSLDIIEAVFCDAALDGWEGFGLAVQSYQKRAVAVIAWLTDMARRQKKKIYVRLIKGAYWDSEIKWAQVQGLSGYPVFTRKSSTDVSFLACAKDILAAPDAFIPSFATHNAHSVAAILELAQGRTDFEFQCLHGMGYTLYNQVVGVKNLNIPCRVYAPVGGHEDLLAYLVRRLLENGANTSFVNRIIDDTLDLDDLVADPVAKVAELSSKPHPKIPLPKDLFAPDRVNSAGIDLTDAIVLRKLQADLENALEKTWQAKPTASLGGTTSVPQTLLDPSNHQRHIGTLVNATEAEVEQSLANAHSAFKQWSHTPVATRASALERAGQLLTERCADFMALAVREGGKTIPDAIAEVREAVDFCYYYAMLARQQLAEPQVMPGPTGEYNHLTLHGRGPIACISPWNFPLAIFLGQVTAALAAGNSVIAKPAAQTPLIAAAAVNLLHDAGIPRDTVQLLPGRGSVVGAKLVSDNRIKGVIFTGSTETAQQINQMLAARSGEIVPFIAETGGQNAMIVDSSALPEQVVADVIGSAFTSAGQRCSALRVLFVQADIADKVLHMLAGAMAELSIGNPSLLATDVGPVIDIASKQALEEHIEKMRAVAKLIYQVPMSEATTAGSYVAPVAFELTDLSVLKREVFGPVLHVIRYQAHELDNVLAQINNTGYGLTLGIHSRIERNVEHIQKAVAVGNTYINRNMIGAVVGVQPFGGEGLSGTGPKAGGPHYLLRLCVERTLTVNTTAAGGNASLLALIE